MNGGRVKWLNEKDKNVDHDMPNVTPVEPVVVVAVKNDGCPSG